jgi:hypothetical protein
MHLFIYAPIYLGVTNELVTCVLDTCLFSSGNYLSILLSILLYILLYILLSILLFISLYILLSILLSIY